MSMSDATVTPADGTPQAATPSGPTPADEGYTEPIEVAKAFVSAVIWGEHITVWEMFSPEARRAVLAVAVKRGMDERLAGRVRDGLAARGERDTFLTDLVNGLRADLRGNDLDALEYQPDPDLEFGQPEQARVMMVAPMHAGLGPPLPVASIELVRQEGSWRVDLLLPSTKA